MVKKIPRHVALIPDGNRRWAREKGLVKTAGHVKAGTYENLFPLLEEARRLGISYVSLWGFSTENWERDKKEVDKILDVISKGLDRLEEEAEREDYVIRHVGRKDRFSSEFKEKLERVEKKTKDNKGLNILLCVDYGGRDEIVRALSKLDGEIDEEGFANLLDTAGMPDPDLIIRTGGERRLSGFMPFQSVYSELYFLDKYFPDFKPEDLRKAVEWFNGTERRFGGD